MNDIKQAIAHLTLLRKLDSGEKKNLYDVAILSLEKQLNNGWIVFEDKLPEPNTDCLISTKNESIMYCRFSGIINEFWSLTTGLTIENVVAWMKKPEPYKAD